MQAVLFSQFCFVLDHPAFFMGRKQQIYFLLSGECARIMNPAPVTWRTGRSAPAMEQIYCFSEHWLWKWLLDYCFYPYPTHSPSLNLSFPVQEAVSGAVLYRNAHKFPVSLSISEKPYLMLLIKVIFFSSSMPLCLNIFNNDTLALDSGISVAVAGYWEMVKCLICPSLALFTYWSPLHLMRRVYIFLPRFCRWEPRHKDAVAQVAQDN